MLGLAGPMSGLEDPKGPRSFTEGLSKLLLQPLLQLVLVVFNS